jgi:hypothetical protein
VFIKIISVSICPIHFKHMYLGFVSQVSLVLGVQILKEIRRDRALIIFLYSVRWGRADV